MPHVAVSHNQPPPPSPPPAAPMIAQQWMSPLWWPPLYPGPLPVAGGTYPSGGTTSSGGMMPMTITPSPVQSLQPMPPELSPASPVVQTLDRDDEEDIAEDQPMPAQPLLPARRPRADSVADPGVAVEAPADVVPVAPPAEVLFRLGDLCPLLKHLLRVLLLQLLRRPDSMTFHRSNRCSQCHSYSLNYLLPPARRRRWMIRLYLNQRQRNTRSKRRTTKS